MGKVIFKILATPLIIIFGVLCGVVHIIIDPIDVTVDFWNDCL